VCHSNRRRVERGPEPRLAVARQFQLDLMVDKTRLRRNCTINEATEGFNAQRCDTCVNLDCKQVDRMGHFQ
jgi:hypothetical protein